MSDSWQLPDEDQNIDNNKNEYNSLYVNNINSSSQKFRRIEVLRVKNIKTVKTQIWTDYLSTNNFFFNENLATVKKLDIYLTFKNFFCCWEKSTVVKVISLQPFCIIKGPIMTSFQEEKVMKKVLFFFALCQQVTS